MNTILFNAAVFPCVPGKPGDLRHVWQAQWDQESTDLRTKWQMWVIFRRLEDQRFSCFKMPVRSAWAGLGRASDWAFLTSPQDAGTLNSTALGTLAEGSSSRYPVGRMVVTARERSPSTVRDTQKERLLLSPTVTGQCLALVTSTCWWFGWWKGTHWWLRKKREKPHLILFTER